MNGSNPCLSLGTKGRNEKEMILYFFMTHVIPSVQRESSIRHIQAKNVLESVFLLFDLVVEIFNFFLMNE